MPENLNNNLLISVIVPVFNIEEYIKKCVASIVNQSYEKLEIILVDDGSTDKSGRICDELAENDARIFVYHKKNGGLSDARNYGIDRANGDIYAFVDGDDRIHHQMFEIMLSKMMEEGAELVTCTFEQKDDGGFDKEIRAEDIKYKIISGADAIKDVEIPLVVAWNKLYKKELFDAVRYPVGKLHEDEFVIHKIFNKSTKVVVLEESLYFYTVRRGSIISDIGEKHVNDALEALSDRVEFDYGQEKQDILPYVLKRYCDYCIDMYYNIKNRKYIMDEIVMNRLWKAEKDILSRYKDIDMDKKYRKFAISPEAYEKYLSSLSGDNTIKRIFLSVINFVGRVFR